jgi:hypothetical protein
MEHSSTPYCQNRFLRNASVPLRSSTILRGLPIFLESRSTPWLSLSLRMLPSGTTKYTALSVSM